MPTDQELSPHEVSIDGYSVTIYAPHRSEVDRSWLEADSSVPIVEIGHRLDPAEPQPTTAMVLCEGSETVLADALRIDFIKEEFDRRPGADDPPAELGFRMANDLLARLRTLGRSGHLKPVSPDSTIWRILYLHDDGSELDPTEGLVRGRFAVTWQWKTLGLRRDLWARGWALPDDFGPTPWDTLLLDALELLPEVGPALVLASAAIETRIASALDVLASESSLNADLWHWINEREGDYRKEPSLVEQADILLRALSGHTLKEEPRLWEAFQSLRRARNSFVHEGHASVGGTPVTRQRASELVALTGDIIDWIERLLPEDHRRPRDPREGEQTMVLTRRLTAGPEPAPAEEPSPPSDSPIEEG